MSFTFKTEVIGLMMDIVGSFDNDELHPGSISAFEIEEVFYRGQAIDHEGLTEEVLTHICEQAHKSAAKAAIEAEQDRYADRFREYGEERYDN